MQWATENPWLAFFAIIFALIIFDTAAANLVRGCVMIAGMFKIKKLAKESKGHKGGGIKMMAEILNEVYFLVKLAAFGCGTWLSVKLITKAVIRSRMNRVASAMHSLGPTNSIWIADRINMLICEVDVTLMRMCSKGLARKVGDKFELTPEGETIIGHDL